MSDRRRRPVTDHVVEQEIKHEQAVVDRIYARLEAATASAQALAALLALRIKLSARRVDCFSPVTR